MPLQKQLSQDLLVAGVCPSFADPKQCTQANYARIRATSQCRSEPKANHRFGPGYEYNSLIITKLNFDTTT